MKKFIVFALLLTSTVCFAENKENATYYKNIMQDLDKVGETSTLQSPKDQEQLLVERVTSLLSWNRSAIKKEDIHLSSGVFTMLAPRKLAITDPFEKNYTGSFSTDQFGSAFLYKDYIITNYHMCRGLNTLIRDYKNNIYAVKVLSFNVKQDVCVLKAPEAVKNQRNFATFKMPLNQISEEVRSLRLSNKIMKIKENAQLSDAQKEEIAILEKEKQSEARDYGYISGAYGEFYIYNIGKDNSPPDTWSKENSMMAYGTKCKGGVSGSPVSSSQGLIGLFWGAEEPGAVANRLQRVSTRSPAFDIVKNPTCYFVDVSEIDKVINQYEKSAEKTK